MIPVSIYSGDMKISGIKEVIYAILIILSFFILCADIIRNNLLGIKKAYRNNKFWEAHKVDIIQNIIFYILGAVTPYIISWIINVININ